NERLLLPDTDRARSQPRGPCSVHVVAQDRAIRRPRRGRRTHPPRRNRRSHPDDQAGPVMPPARSFPSSWPGLSRPSTSFDLTENDVDARDKPGHDAGDGVACTRRNDSYSGDHLSNRSQMSLKLFELVGADASRPFSPFCWRTRMALAHKGLSAETIPWCFT